LGGEEREFGVNLADDKDARIILKSFRKGVIADLANPFAHNLLERMDSRGDRRTFLRSAYAKVKASDARLDDIPQAKI
jgi:hypothetical protein